MSDINPGAGTGSNESTNGKLSPALKKELKNIFLYIIIGLCIMFAIFFAVMCIFPEIKENTEFEYWKIALGGICGGGVAFLNFLLMGLTVQKVAADDNKERARSRMKMSYTYRYLMQIAWIVIAILVPCFNYIAAIIPLLFPSFGIKIASIIFKKN
ncbi:MAG: ATP synthase subunit I [Lachnospiraceae bacterium]|nr:ATP synthase subunit I [Lachnospiraceae bacterium]MBR5177175.1 ATP synthase subunit I [Lachnospiraceae bacterium]